MVSYTTAIVAPLGAWLLWDAAEYYLPKDMYIPVVSYFRREWASNPESQGVHMKLLGDLALFSIVVYQFFNQSVENSIRAATGDERDVIEKGMDVMAQKDYESHAKCMETLLVKHKISAF